MNTEDLKPITGHDVAIEIDMFGNESVHITKSKGIIIKPTLWDYIREQRGGDTT